MIDEHAIERADLRRDEIAEAWLDPSSDDGDMNHSQRCNQCGGLHGVIIASDGLCTHCIHEEYMS